MIDDNSKEFIKRHIGPSEEDQSKICLLYTSDAADE